MESQEAFGIVLRALRKQQRMTQQRLAENADLERNYISLIELGQSYPTICVVFKLCNGLGVLPSVLFARVEEFIQSHDEKHPAKRHAR